MTAAEPTTSEPARRGPRGASASRGDAATRREDVLDAAVAEFAEHGFHGASTPAIARRAGISQPYIYALFASKKVLFAAAHTRVVDRIREGFTAAPGGAQRPAPAPPFNPGSPPPPLRSARRGPGTRCAAPGARPWKPTARRCSASCRARP